MIAPNYNKFCSKAERHYFDFLRKEAKGAVPGEVAEHISGCIHCREQISRFEAMLADLKEHPQTHQTQHQKAVTAILKLHFSFVGKPVNCADARPFLPHLSNPELQIRVPTPITAHIGSCERCKEDAEKLQNLGIGSKQLITLSQLFADELDADETDCIAAREAIPAVVAMAFERTDAKTLRHLSLCPKCRQKLYEFRQTIIGQTKLQHSGNENHSGFPCSSVETSDIFDYGILYGIDPKSDEYAKFRESLSAHIACCADCLDKTQQLHKTIYTIVERPESETVTVFHIDTSAEAKSPFEAENIYAGFPVTVERVNSDSRNQSPAGKYEKVVKLKPASNKVKHLLKMSLPVAALIAVAIGLSFYVSVAKGLGIKQIYSAIDAVKNIHITHFVPENQQPGYEEWRSRSFGLYVLKQQNNCFLYNIYTHTRKAKNLITGKIEQTSLDNDAIDSFASKISDSLSIMPFRTSSEIPAESQWSEITVSDNAYNSGSTKAYELSWPVNTLNGSVIHRKWRVFMDASGNLPQKVQSFIQTESDPEPVLESFMIIDYPADEEIASNVENLSF